MEKRTIPEFFDGAFGTYYARLFGEEGFCEEANVTAPEKVGRIHEEYLKAGVGAIKTNTFGANGTNFGAEKLSEVINTGYDIAVKAAEKYGARVFADIGVVDEKYEIAVEKYNEVADIFLSHGAKDFLFETLDDAGPVIPVAAKIKEKQPNSTVILSFAVSPDGYTRSGKYYKELIAQCRHSGVADAAGLNCLCGASHMHELLKALGNTDFPITAMPNAGYPVNIGGRTVYRDNAEYFSEKLAMIKALGVTSVGGCCGTTPEHIALAIEKIRSGTAKADGERIKSVSDSENIRKNSFKEKLTAGKKVLAVEIDPPTDTGSGFIIDAAKKAKAFGADIVTVSDSPLARTRADSVIMAAKIKRETGVETLPHMTCRDKNTIAIKAAVLGASIEGINNIFAITGDPACRTEGKPGGVFSMNSYGLISFLKSLNGETLSECPIYIGAALNVNAVNFDAELSRAEKKKECGAGFLLTQAIFTDEALENLRKAKERLGDMKILAGILPVSGYKNAVFLNNEVAGITVPDKLIAELAGKTKEEAWEISAQYSFETAKSAAPYCDGFYIMTPIRNIDLVSLVAERMKKGALFL